MRSSVPGAGRAAAAAAAARSGTKRITRPRPLRLDEEHSAEQEWVKAASKRVSRSQALGASLLDEMDRANFTPPIQSSPIDPMLSSTVIPRTASGGEPESSEWKPVLLEHEQKIGAAVARVYAS